MSKSDVEPDLPNTESLFDLLYLDGRRAAIYLSQLDPNGVLTGIKTSVSGTTTVTGKGRGSIALVSGAIEGTDASTEASEQQFDPKWAAPIALMNRLDELGFIHRGLEGAAVGSLVLLKGLCRIVDVATVKEMWPAITGLMEQELPKGEPVIHENRKARRDAQRRERPTAAPSHLRSVLAMLGNIAKFLPHGLDLHMITEQGLVWATLERDCLLTKAEDVALKFGSALAGEWYLLGVVDADPSDPTVNLWDGLPTSDFTKAMVQLLEAIRQTMGRPPGYHAVTPLLLFRTIMRPAPTDG